MTIRNAQTEFYHVTEYEDGTVKLEPRVLVSPHMLEQIDAAVKRHKAGRKGTKLDWSKPPRSLSRRFTIFLIGYPVPAGLHLAG